MSFWGGMAKGMEAGLAKREREEARDEDQAWREKMHSYQLGRDKVADARAAKSSELTEFNTLMGLADKLSAGSFGPTTGSTVSKSSRGSTATAEHSLKVMLREGASPDVLETFAGYGRIELDRATTAWGKYKEATKNHPQFTPMSIDDFLKQSIATKTEAERPNLDFISMLGVDLDSRVGSTDLTRREVLDGIATVPARWDVTYFNSSTVPDKTDVEAILKSATDGLVESLKMKAVSLGKKLARISEEQDEGKLQSIAEDNGYDNIEKYKDDLAEDYAAVGDVTGKDDISMEAYKLADPNLLLSKLWNNPGALNYKWGPLWDSKIKDRTYSSLDELYEAIRSENLNEYDYYILEEDGQKSLMQVPSE